MSTDREIIVVDGVPYSEMSELKSALRKFLLAQENVISCCQVAVQDPIEAKLNIEYKAPPIFELPDLIVTDNTKPKRKGKTPRKKQNGYF